MASNVRIIDPSDGNLSWEKYEMSFDETPSHVGAGSLVDVFSTKDKKVQFYLWKRDADIGVLNPNVENPEGLTKFDIVLEGEVEVTDADGVTHTAKAGQILTYSGTDTGRWNQPGRILKIALLVRD